MSVLLIQVNGAKLSETAPPGHIEAGGQGPRYCDDPIVHKQYVNGGDHWKQEGFGRREAWESTSSGDVALLYSTSDVHEKWGASLSHLLRVEEKQIDSDGARLFFDKVVELQSKIAYQDIRQELEEGNFSERMGYCGQEGFNITRVTERDLETVLSLTDLDRADILD